MKISVYIPPGSDEAKAAERRMKDWGKAFWVSLAGFLLLVGSRNVPDIPPLVYAGWFCLGLAILSVWRETVWRKRFVALSVVVREDDDE